MKSVKSMASKKKPAYKIKQLLHSRIAGMDPPRSLKIIHASSLTYEAKPWCPRAVALMLDTNKKPKDEFLGTSLRVTFDHGNDMQRRLNEEYLTDVVVGDWKCRSCGTKKSFCKKPKSKCGKNGITCNWGYEEVRVKSDNCGASGGIDALINVGETKLRLTEVKTMDKDIFRDLKAALAEHRMRTNLYMRLVDESSQPWAKRINTEEATVLYMVKAFGFKDTDCKKWGIKDAPFSPFKEFTVKRDDSQTDHLISMSKVLYQYLEGGAMPCGICINQFTKTAQQCPVMKECFSGSYPPKATWVNAEGKPEHKGKKVIKP